MHTALQAVDSRFGCEVDTLIGKPRHELFRRQMRVARTAQHRDDLGLFDRRQCIARATMRSTAGIITAGPIAPALNGASRDADDLTGLGETRTGSLRVIDRGED